MRGWVRDLHGSYGFIQGDDGRRYFFLGTAVQATSIPFGEIQPGAEVTFLPIVHPQGPRAIEVRVTRRHVAEEEWP